MKRSVAGQEEDRAPEHAEVTGRSWEQDDIIIDNEDRLKRSDLQFLTRLRPGDASVLMADPAVEL
ncbi:hypothetical protein EYF80_022386 [Liparis tanakae]|uniref:Uncharacterized protein n=1 Tax=Liparis tanakae TaxID=230148 RepID=A0A4Z2HPC2_9TELE|nr:hypothetical protein EYF80_022386 [Liparis tanakae]